MKEYEITFDANSFIGEEKVTIIAESLSNALDLFNSYASNIKKFEILNIKLIKYIKNCLIEKMGD